MHAVCASLPSPCPAFGCIPSMALRAASPADNTLLQNEDFWSSTGNPDPDSSESLLYRLAPPLCALHSVTIGVYRARYQFGCVLGIALVPSHT